MNNQHRLYSCRSSSCLILPFCLRFLVSCFRGFLFCLSHPAHVRRYCLLAEARARPQLRAVSFTLTLPPGDFAAYIFDCDGTLADTMPTHYRAWCAALGGLVGMFPEALFYELGGVPTSGIVELLNERHGLNIAGRTIPWRGKRSSFWSLATRWRRLSRWSPWRGSFPGVKPLAVASGGHRRIVMNTLRALGIAGLFQAIVTAEDYQRGKPSPDPFLEAAHRLNVDPASCLVFEDTAIGVAAATAAGMQSVLIPRPPGWHTLIRRAPWRARQLLPALKQYFGYDSFRPLQEEIIADALAGRDVFALLPTGGGKSLCFQLPALLRPGLTVVVSPLIALMKDQVDALSASGVAATFLNSTLDGNEARARLRGLHNGEYQLLYAAPERLMLPGFIEKLQGWGVAQIAVDEAHCISEWGHDFRPEYRQIARLRDYFPDTPVMALTATATERVRVDIVRQLRLREAREYVASFNRPNLFYRVAPKERRL